MLTVLFGVFVLTLINIGMPIEYATPMALIATFAVHDLWKALSKDRDGGASPNSVWMARWRRRLRFDKE